MTRLAATLVLLASLAAAGGCGRGSGAAAPPVAPARSERPQRIVSMAPSVTEVLFALGLDEEIVGISDADDFPPGRLEGRTRVGGVVVGVERIVALRPDLVIGVAGIQKEQIDRVRSAGVPVLAVDADTFDEALALIREVGEMTGRAGEAEALAASLAIRAASVQPAPPCSVYIEVWHEPLIAAGGRTLIDDLVTRSGGKNIFSGLQGYKQVQPEGVIASSPEVVLLLYPGASRLRERSGWRHLPAVRSGRVYELPTSLVSRPGPRVVEGLSLVARLLRQAR